jgi:2-polyprenyl-3-methyl-5-hydroxy-6-metoxy-1,4-benzoquinol methylase
VLDMGCGRGDLTGYLLEKYEVVAADLSRDSVATVERRFAGHPRFRGVTVGTAELPSDSVDLIFILEVVEHLEDEALEAVLGEAHRLLRRGGHLVLSTPNDENLEANKVICPECACIFHRVEHVRSWTTKGLTEHVARYGFQGEAFATRLFPDTGAKQWARRMQARLLRHNNPHMIYIGKKR